MQINELSQITGVSPKTIRFYEEMGVLPPPKRLPNGYRAYNETDVARLELAAGMRQLDFALDDIGEIIAMRDRREAPCRVVLDLMQQKADEIAQRIQELQDLAAELRILYTLGRTFPTDDVEGKNCVCHLVSKTP